MDHEKINDAMIFCTLRNVIYILWSEWASLSTAKEQFARLSFKSKRKEMICNMCVIKKINIFFHFNMSSFYVQGVDQSGCICSLKYYWRKEGGKLNFNFSFHILSNCWHIQFISHHHIYCHIKFHPSLNQLKHLFQIQTDSNFYQKW